MPLRPSNERQSKLFSWNLHKTSYASSQTFEEACGELLIGMLHTLYEREGGIEQGTIGAANAMNLLTAIKVKAKHAFIEQVAEEVSKR